MLTVFIVNISNSFSIEKNWGLCQKDTKYTWKNNIEQKKNLQYAVFLTSHTTYNIIQNKKIKTHFWKRPNFAFNLR